MLSDQNNWDCRQRSQTQDIVAQNLKIVTPTNQPRLAQYEDQYKIILVLQKKSNIIFIKLQNEQWFNIYKHKKRLEEMSASTLVIIELTVVGVGSLFGFLLVRVSDGFP